MGRLLPAEWDYPEFTDQASINDWARAAPGQGSILTVYALDSTVLLVTHNVTDFPMHDLRGEVPSGVER